MRSNYDEIHGIPMDQKPKRITCPDKCVCVCMFVWGKECVCGCVYAHVHIFSMIGSSSVSRGNPFTPSLPDLSNGKPCAS